MTTRVLFVDDEASILKAFRRMFYRRREWEIHCESSGEAAIARLEKEPFDVLVTDMRMPGVSGVEVLRAAHRLQPNLIRIVVSGYADEEAALRAVGIAHQFMDKPSEPEVLSAAIERAQALQEALSSERVRQMVTAIPNLPPVPEVHRRLLELMASNRSDAEEVAALIETDPALSARIIQVVNSAFFANAAPITRLRDAVVRLGFSLVRSIVMQMEVFDAFDLAPSFLRAQQEHAVKVGRLAREIAPADLADDAFLAGLLHDVGRLILAAAAHSEEETDSHHAIVGAHLLSLWGMPYPIVDAVMHHHEPNRLGPQLGISEAVYCANTLLEGEEIHSGLLHRLQAWDLEDEWKRKRDAL
ncbi:MAG: HDOD domain-containing protein [Deltaproteobacteria bacterium]|nr:MAG: HDOD domain-containing protein [Deltaproteobacteria bacterium]